ncbi:MAG: type II toxin-antitoxin system VapC family toxin [Armatimonadetes bacterium]|nr:type II toxin-antitoxin system VapC family toxin [Armatimonadota bacterium]
MWIDLSNGDLVSEVFRLPHECSSPRAVLDELGEELGATVVGLGLTVYDTGPEGEAQFRRLRTAYNRPSDADVYAVVQALATGARLVTGDRRTREAGEREGLAVAGLLWLLDELVGGNVIEPAAAAVALQTIREHGARLPDDECEARLRRWRS